MSSESWAQYADYARRLDGVRAEEVARTAGMRQGVAEMSTRVDEFQGRLAGQGGMLLSLGTELRFRRPKLTPIPPEGPVDPATDLEKLAREIDQGDLEAKRCATRGSYPALLPKLSTITRSLVVYGGAALLVLAYQLLAVRPLLRSEGERAADPGHDPSAIKALVLVPLIGFAIGYLVLALGSRTRNPQAPEPSTVRMGLLLCLGIGPVAVLAYIIAGHYTG